MEGGLKGLRGVAVAGTAKAWEEGPGQVSWLVTRAGRCWNENTASVEGVFTGSGGRCPGWALGWALWSPNERVTWAGGLTWAPGRAAAPGSALKVGPTGLLASAWDRARRRV